MDNTDRKLLVLVHENPRIHLQELAGRLGISRQAAHHRLQALKKIGVIKGMIAGISISYLDAVPMAICGPSKAASIYEVLDELGKSEFTRRSLVAGGNYVYVVGFLRNISELDEYVEFVKRVAEMPEPIVGIYCQDDDLMPYSVDGSGKRKQSYKELSALDLRIIASLKDDARRPTAEIAEMVGVSPKTVRRRLENMRSDGSLDMGMPMDAQAGGDLLLIMHVNLREGADKRNVGRRLLSKNYFQDQYIRTYSNLPSLLMWVFWSDKITEIRKALKETGDDKDVQSTMLNFAYIERMYTTWRDKLPAAQLRTSRKAVKHRLRSKSTSP